ncbi:MAG: lactate utilization protein C [Pseudomonadota bacterium]
MNSRESILARIRANLGKPSGEPNQQEIMAVLEYLNSHPSGPRPHGEWTDLTERFKARAKALGSTVDEVVSMAEVPNAIHRYLEANALPKSGICWPEFAELTWQDAGITLAVRSVENKDMIGITGTFCAIAETGTLMLLSGAATPAATSLLPETHIAILDATRICKGMEDAWNLLREEKGKVPRSVNFISGPSRTADIEQTIVIGAHGPFRVHVIVVS